MADDQDKHLKPLSGLDSRVVVLIVLVSKGAVSGLSVLGSKFVTALHTSIAIWANLAYAFTSSNKLYPLEIVLFVINYRVSATK